MAKIWGTNFNILGHFLLPFSTGYFNKMGSIYHLLTSVLPEVDPLSDIPMPEIHVDVFKGCLI